MRFSNSSSVISGSRIGLLSGHLGSTMRTFYRQALALADELGMRPLLAHCHFGLRILYNRIGRPEQARTALSAAIELYRAMEMTLSGDVWLVANTVIVVKG